MTKRVGISKRLRFELFKRDNFTCQYCGGHPPAVILHLDHIEPVSKGGQSSRDNLVTSCDACNLGKSNVPLSVIPKSLAGKAEEVAEREQQIKGYYAVITAQRERIEQEVWSVVDILDPNNSGIRKDWFQSIKRFIEKLGYPEVVDSMEIATAKGIYSENKTFAYFCGVCWHKIRDGQNG